MSVRALDLEACWGLVKVGAFGGAGLSRVYVGKE